MSTFLLCQHDPPLLWGENLTRSFTTGRKKLFGRRKSFNGVSGVSLELGSNETLAVVGESGCGKSTLGKMLLGLLPPSEGQVHYQGQDINMCSSKEWRQLRSDLQIIFQDTGSSLDPRLPVKLQVREPLDIHDIGLPNERDRLAAQMLSEVKLGSSFWDRAPHELSGGQLQRVVLARALMLRPKVIVCDEPVSALDVSIQAQVINLLKDLQQEFGLSYLFISHDLSIVRHVADRVAVMYLGKIVETADVKTLYTRPKHPYTQSLLGAIPLPDPSTRRKRILLKGDPPNPQNPPSGCGFHPRCPLAGPECSQWAPQLTEVAPGQEVACLLTEKSIDEGA